jgi:hypothetical protein
MSEAQQKLKKRVINYIQTTNKIKQVNEKIKQLRQTLKPYEERKRKLAPHILTYLNSTNTTNTKGLQIHNYKLTAVTSKRTQCISKDYLQQSLTSYFNDDKKKAQHLLDYIYNNRKVTKTQNLRQTEMKTKSKK